MANIHVNDLSITKQTLQLYVTSFPIIEYTLY
jgi:hypothetical protein